MVTLPECVITRGMLWRSKVNAQAWRCCVDYPCMQSMRGNVMYYAKKLDIASKMWRMTQMVKKRDCPSKRG